MRKWIVPGLLMCLLVLVRVGNSFFMQPPAELTILQLALFPVTCVAAFFCVPRGKTLLASLILLIGAIGTLFAVNSHYHLLRPHGTIFFSRLAGDADDSMTREFLQRVETAAKDANAPAYFQQHFESIPNAKEANAAMDRFKKANAIVYGSKRWLQVSLNLKHFEPFFNVPVFQATHPARLITYVPQFGMSADPMGSTATFLGLFFGAMEAAKPEEKIRLLATAADMKAGWTLYGHSAYADWLGATIILAKAVRAPTLEIAELVCAQDKLAEAQSRLRPGDNTLLLAAIVNNKAIVTHLLYQLQQQSTVTPAMLDEELSNMLQLKKEPAPNAYSSVAGMDIFKALKQTRRALRVTPPKRKHKVRIHK